MDLGVLLLIAIVIGLPLWLARGLRNRMKERFAPVPARSTTVVLDHAVQPAATPLPLPSMLSQVVIRTGHRGNISRFTKDGASGDGMDGGDHCNVAHGSGHGHGDGHG